MISVSSNISQVVLNIKSKLEDLKDPAGLLQTVALAVLPEMRKRVHEHGKDWQGSQIGTYSKEYMVVRTGSYKNADRISRGKNKGKLKNSGYFTKGQNATYSVATRKPNVARPKYNRGPDTKVILALTSQMENDMNVVATSDGYGIGYNNPFNLKKALWNEQRYRRAILSKLSSEEEDLVISVADNYVNEKLNSSAV